MNVDIFSGVYTAFGSAKSVESHVHVKIHTNVSAITGMITLDTTYCNGSATPCNIIIHVSIHGQVNAADYVQTDCVDDCTSMHLDDNYMVADDVMQ